MTDLTIRPTAKFIVLRVHYRTRWFFWRSKSRGITQWKKIRKDRCILLPLIAPLSILWPAWQAVHRRFTT